MGRTYAPVSKTKFVRDAGAKDYLSSPAKKSRAEQYYEEYDTRRLAAKNVHKVAESKPVPPVKVIEKKPALYNESKNEWDEPPKPKRVRPRRKTDQQKPNNAATAKLVEKGLDEKGAEKDVAASKKVAEMKTKKAPESKPTVEPNQHGQYETDNLTANILQDELKQIMIKVWQELPDSPPTEAEEVVTNKFRNEAGDDLANAMGLNVTARLLNVHNPLYAKLYFSGKPEAGCLQAFINDHKITAFKRIAHSDRDIFAARFDHIADFDRLCVHSEVKCGSATVQIVPCYKYFSSPPAIKSIYADNIANIKKKTDSSPQKTDTDKIEKSVAETKEKSIENAEAKTDNAKVDKKVNAEKEVIKTPSNTTKTVTATKVAEAKTVTVKPTAQEKPKALVKETPKDAPVVKKVTPKKVENNVSKSDKQAKIDIIDDMMVVDEEIGEEENDDEEMTDQDILALMSGGIVLDECSGSDEEK